MCITAAPARLSKTILYAAEIEYGLHVLGYQNTVQNTHPGPNAMILPFPAKPGSMTRNNVISTQSCPNILKDMAEAVTPVKRSIGKYTSSDRSSLEVEVFDSGIYTVVLAQDARFIPEAIGQVPPHKRPPVSNELFDAFSEWYPKFPIALCCFNNQEALNATPMLWWYETSWPDRLFAPAVDSHTGGVPDLKSNVDVDHTVIVGSKLFAKQRRFGPLLVIYRDFLTDEISRFVLNYVIGNVHNGEMPNGDFVFDIKTVREHIYRPSRIPPV